MPRWIVWEDIMLQSVSTPETLAQVRSLLAAGSATAVLAGGTELMPFINQGTDAVTALVSLRKAGLSGIAIEGQTVTIGAMTTLSELQDEAALGFLGPALDTIASPTIRNMATVGGNLFVRQPYGDLAACLIALGATATIAGPSGSHMEAVERLVATGAGSGEIVTQVSFAMPASGTFKFAKAGRKALNAAAMVTVAAVVTLTDGCIADCRIALGGVARHALRARSVEAALAGKPFDRENVAAAAAEAARDIDPFDDAYASAWYRARVTPVHIRRALIDS